MLRASDILSRTLYESGCRHAIGMAGGEVLTLIDSLEGSGIRYFSCSHENSGGFVAEGIHHVGGSIALLVATLGPGAMNCVNVIANAYQDKVPMILLTGCVDKKDYGVYTHQVMDHGSVFSSIVKSTYVLTPENCAKVAVDAITTATTPPFGPVHIDVPITVADTNVTLEPLPIPTYTPIAPPSDLLSQSKDLLESSQTPLAIIGVDALNNDASTELQNFLERFSIPFITTYKAKGIVSELHPLSLGAAGLSPLADEHLKPIIHSSDLILCLGYDPIEMRIGWQDLWDINDCSVIEISPTFSTHGMHKSTLKLECDIPLALTSLISQCDCPSKSVNPLLASTCMSLSTAFPTDEEWGPSAIIDESQRVLPKDTIATVDSGAHRILLSHLWRCESPRTLLQSTAFCTMGCAIPLALGYKLGCKLSGADSPVVCFSGDAGLLMVAGELSMAKSLDTPLIFVIFADSSLSLIELKQRSRGLGVCGVAVPSHNLATLSESFGGEGIDVYDRAGLRLALEKSLNSATFTLISAHLPLSSYDGKF